MNGDGFEAFVKQGDVVKAGQTLVMADLDKIEKAGLSTQTMVIVTNSAQYTSIEGKTGLIKVNNPVLTVR